MSDPVARRRLVLPRPTAWHVFVLLLVVALGSEYWDKDPLTVGAGLQLPWPKFILALVVLPLLVSPRDWRWTRLFRVSATLGPLVLFWICCGLSLVGIALAPGRSDGIQFLKTFVHLSMYVVFVYVLVEWMTSRRLLLLINAYYLLGVAAALLALLQFLHGTFGWFPWLAPFRFQSAEYREGSGLSLGFRASSVFGEPSWAARYYVHWVALALAYWWQTRQRRHLAALMLFVAAFYVANSLVGYAILCTFGMAVGIAYMWRRNMFALSKRQKVGAVAAAYVLALLWLIGLTPPIPDLVGRSIARVELVLQGGGAVGNRFDGIRAGLEVWKLAPVFGVGLGNISGHIVEFYKDPDYIFRSRFVSDSVYVQLLAETGLVGLLSFLYFWGRLVQFAPPSVSAGRASVEETRARAWLRFLQLDLIGQAVGMLNYSDYLNPHFWTIVAVVLACKTLIRREAPVVPEAVRRPVAVGIGPSHSFAS